MKKKKVYGVIKIALIVLACVVFLLPIYYLVINSFKPLKDILLSFTAFPKSLTFDNYVGAARKINYLQIFGNTLFLTVGSVLITLMFSTLAGYKLQRTHGRLSNLVRGYLSLGLMVPFAVIMVPLSQIIGRMGLNNNLAGLAFVYAAMYMPMMIFVYSGYCKNISYELDEAAIIDGCNQLQVFVWIILPLTKPIIVTMAVLAAVWTWNDLLVALISIDDLQLMTLTRRIQNFIGFQSGTEWDFFTAAVSLSMLPIIVLYAFLQKRVQAGLTSGAIKA